MTPSGLTNNDDGNRIRLVLIYGGVSAEHDISCLSAANVAVALDPKKYDVVLVGITREGHWCLNDSVVAPFRDTEKNIPFQLRAEGEVIDPLHLLDRETYPRMVVFPLVHGPHGEDGTLQGFLELAGVAYVGSGVLGSAICMDKTMAKTLAGAAGIPQAKSFNLTPGSGGIDALANRVEMLMDLGNISFPVFVKPASMGSSVGITKAHDFDALVHALGVALRYDERLTIEENIVGREIEVAVLGNSIGGNPPRASVPGEIVPGAEFYDYADKYATDAATILIPAELDADEVASVQALALEAYDALRCDGFARVDFFYEPNGRGFLLNEINTIPGFTSHSLYPKMWDASGLGYLELLDELVNLAKERHQRRAPFSTAI